MACNLSRGICLQRNKTTGTKEEALLILRWEVVPYVAMSRLLADARPYFEAEEHRT